MTTNEYVSNVMVEIAFNAGFNTPAASRTWTDVSEWVELGAGISIGYGRQDERSQAEANTLSLTLDNSDGRFTPNRAGSPYSPNVKLYRPIRVTVTPPGGTASVRFVGYINEWPVAWSGTDTYATSPLTASSRLARLGLTDVRRSVLEETYLLSGPTGLYPLGEPEGSVTVEDVTGKSAPPFMVTDLGSAITFAAAVGPPSDALAAPKFTGGAYLNLGNYGPGSNEATVEFWFSTTGQPDPESEVLFANYRRQEGSVMSAGPTLFVDRSTGRLNLKVQSGVGGDVLDLYASPVSVIDGLVHHVAVTLTRTRVVVYLDDAVTLDEVIAPELPFLAGRLSLGGNGTAFNSSFTGSLAQFVTYDKALASSTIAAHRNAGLNGNASESSGTRFSTVAQWAGATETVTDGLDQVNRAIDTAGSSVVDLLRQVEATEFAVLHDRRDGQLSLTAESVRYTASPAFVLDMGLQHVEADFAPQLDPSAILNDVTVSTVNDGPTARVASAGSRNDYGVSATSYQVGSTDDGRALQVASWQVVRYAEPRVRVPSVTVDVGAQVGKTPAPNTLLAADIHTLFQIANQPTQADDTTGTYFVEGCTETIGVYSHVLSFNVSPAWPFVNVFILDDTVRGVLDSSYMLGL